MRWYGADVTFLGMHAPEFVFGLGEKTVADRIHVAWADGKTSTLTVVSAGSVDVVHPERETEEKQETGHENGE